jgi:hypothetical protein
MGDLEGFEDFEVVEVELVDELLDRLFGFVILILVEVWFVSTGSPAVSVSSIELVMLSPLSSLVAASSSTISAAALLSVTSLWFFVRDCISMSLVVEVMLLMLLLLFVVVVIAFLMTSSSSVYLLALEGLLMDGGWEGRGNFEERLAVIVSLAGGGTSVNMGKATSSLLLRSCSNGVTLFSSFIETPPPPPPLPL